MQLLLTRERAAFGEWQVLHLIGNADRTPIERSYRDAGVRAQVIPFLHEMGLAWGAADLALSRAGANSVAEAILNAVPTVFAPYPYHADLHQKWNAKPYHDEGVCVLCEDAIDAQRNALPGGSSLGATLIDLLCDHARRETMRAALLARPRQDAATEIAKAAIELAR